MNPHDHPDLTAHVLGELDAEHAEAMAQWIAENPSASAEAEGIADLAQHLRVTARMPKVQLHPHQREAILSGPQLVRKMVEVASQKPKRRSTLVPLLNSIGRIAAAVVLLVGGFMAGSRYTKQTAKLDITKAPTSPSAPVETTAEKPRPFKAKELTVVATSEPAKAEPALVKVEQVTPAQEPKTKVETLVVATAPVNATAPVVVPNRPNRTEMKVMDEAMVATTKSAVAQVNLHPSKTRPGAVVSAERGAAAPMTGHEKPIVASPTKKPELLIHSWKAEIASCPWNEAHRLIRLSIQMPGEQAAALKDQTYPIQVNFQQGFVRSYRQISRRTVPAATPEEAGLHVVWYEFVPNGVPADTVRDGTGRAIASVSLANAKFTTAAMGPFDGATKLQMVDTGLPWSEASSDFAFESALNGFGLLLKGASDAPNLNHSLVLSLADGAAAKDDRNGERAKFVKLVREAQKATGL